MRLVWPTGLFQTTAPNHRFAFRLESSRQFQSLNTTTKQQEVRTQCGPFRGWPKRTTKGESMQPRSAVRNPTKQPMRGARANAPNPTERPSDNDGNQQTTCGMTPQQHLLRPTSQHAGQPIRNVLQKPLFHERSLGSSQSAIEQEVAIATSRALAESPQCRRRSRSNDDGAIRISIDRSPHPKRERLTR